MNIIIEKKEEQLTKFDSRMKLRRKINLTK